MTPPDLVSDERLLDLLEKTSRTFALSIPVLDEPMRREVTVAYLLFRIADTFEDAWVWPQERRIGELERFATWMDAGVLPEKSELDATVSSWLEDPPSEHEGYLELLRETPGVLASWSTLDAEPRKVLANHTARTCRGMAEFVARSDERGHLSLLDLADLQAYCYVVAGIVGELLTELFILHEDGLGAVARSLRERAATFGEALQLVNILKDAADDAVEGRRFLPRDLDRRDVFAVARRDLGRAEEYVRLLQSNGASRGAVSFTALPVLLAWATLEVVERDGPGAKVSRETVARLGFALQVRLESGEPAV